MPSRQQCPWDFPGKNTRVDGHFFSSVYTCTKWCCGWVYYTLSYCHNIINSSMVQRMSKAFHIINLGKCWHLLSWWQSSYCILSGIIQRSFRDYLIVSAIYPQLHLCMDWHRHYFYSRLGETVSQLQRDKSFHKNAVVLYFFVFLHARNRTCHPSLSSRDTLFH